MKNYPNIEAFNRLWKEGVIRKPIIVLIGGAAGTGKTTIAESIMPFIPFTGYLSTTLVRSILRSLLSQEEYPELFANTFDLDNGEDITSLINKYQKQAKLITKYVENYFKSIISEKQHYIIEGSNILPVKWEQESLQDSTIIDIYVEIPKNLSLYREMLCGPTHNRKVEDWQFNNCIAINNYVVEQAWALNKTVINYKTPIRKILEIIDTRLIETIDTI